jgi:type II secretory pathway component PulM
MASESYEPTYRQERVDKRLQDHERRITKNERRWLMTKGALVMLAVVGGSAVGPDVLTSII